MSILKLLFVLLLIGLIGIYVFVQSGLYNVAATEKDGSSSSSIVSIKDTLSILYEVDINQFIVKDLMLE